MREVIGLVAVAAAVLILSGCGPSGSSQSSSANPSSGGPVSTPPASSTSQPAPVSNTTMVSIQNFVFGPATLTVKAGTTVTWTNNDSAPHTIKSATFNSSNLAKGDTFQFTFSTPGTFDYSCGIHPSMLGKIIVE